MRPRARGDDSLAEILEALAKQALAIAKMARKHRQNLARNNFYGNKLAELRADAANVFREMSAKSTGDTTALAELIESVFAASTNSPKRFGSVQELIFALRTTWREPKSTKSLDVDEGFFPQTILAQANRGYLSTLGRQMNGCFAAGWYDACAVIMRRLIEISIIEAFEHKGIANKIKGTDDNYFPLSALVAVALAEPSFTLSRKAKKSLPQLRDMGHMAAHGRYFLTTKDDMERVRFGCRIVMEEFLHHAGLLERK